MKKWIVALNCLMAIFLSNCQQHEITTDLRQGFQNPPKDSRPLTWWHWLDGHVTKDGITKDLEAMKEVGIGGVLLFNGSFYQEGEAPFISDAWWANLKHAIQESDRLDLTFGVFSGEGWSMSGGPWITPEESMKKLVWADTVINGGKPMNIVLPQPEQHLIYKDIAVLAVPFPANSPSYQIKELGDRIYVSDSENAFDNNPQTVISFDPPDTSVSASIIIDLGSSHILRSMTLNAIDSDDDVLTYATLFHSLDGADFEQVEIKLPLDYRFYSNASATLSFATINARYLKLAIKTAEVPNKIKVGEIEFSADPRINLWEAKIGESQRVRHPKVSRFRKELLQTNPEHISDSLLIQKEEIVDLTPRVNAEGILTWEVPQGMWKIMRVGYTSTGAMNHPTSKHGQGLETDKMDPKVTKKHFDAFLGKVIQLSQETINRPIDYAELDSWEAGMQNWTLGFEEEFEKRNSYSILPWLPVLMGGQVVHSYDASDRFLRDFRNTIADMIAENYWQVTYDLCQQNGVQLYGEASGNKHYLYDPILYQQYTHVPMGEFWSNNDKIRVDCKNAASVVNTHGKRIAAAEAFTSSDRNAWRITPADLKQRGDEAFCAGINQFVFHTYVHQPHDVAPGFTLKRWGNHFQRLNNWFMHSQGWMKYISRCQYLLQQGDRVTDVAYFTGEGVPGSLGLREDMSPGIPDGYDYDGVNLNLLQRATVVDGKLVLASGTSYHLLVINDSKKMSIELAKQIKRLVEKGATVMAEKPLTTLSLTEYEGDARLTELAEEVWGNDNTTAIKEHTYGQGQVIWDLTVAEALESLSLPPDFSYTEKAENIQINYVHSFFQGLDIYFIANPTDNPADIKASFRVTGRVPEIWNPETGELYGTEYSETKEGLTEIGLQLTPKGSTFIVFVDESDLEQPKEYTDGPSQTLALQTPWNVSFTSFWEEPEDMQLDELNDWTLIEELKYFSGTGSYSSSFELNEKPTKVVLDLGQVHEIAEVSINGQQVANLWRAPYVVDVTDYLSKGTNTLQINVTNTTVNRLIGDEQYPVDMNYKYRPKRDGYRLRKFPDWYPDIKKRESERQSFVTYRYFKKDSELQSSGLIGPVTIRSY